MLNPTTAEELAEALGSASSRGQSVALAGNSSKRRMAGPVEAADIAITTTGLGRVLEYEPGDLTVSVEAGLAWCEFTRILAGNRQMVPLDPPFGDRATVGGVIATNSSGPRRKQYGTARDFVIGMQFATMEGKLVSSGGMVRMFRSIPSGRTAPVARAPTRS
jgi:glycolate oxidase FAD binding subunit